MHATLLTEVDSHILRIGFNRPGDKNAFDVEMYLAASELLKQADSDPDVRVIYLYGANRRFTSGNDMQELLAATRSGNTEKRREVIESCRTFLLQIAQTEKPIVAAVEGLAVGVGVTMLFHCDLIYAAKNSRFTLPFVDLGLLPEGGSSAALPRLVGHARAAELLMLGKRFNAQTAYELGIINAVCESDKVQETAWATALKLASKPANALRETKALMKVNRGRPLTEVISAELDRFYDCFGSEETTAAITKVVRPK